MVHYTFLVSTSSPDKTTPRTSAKATITTEGTVQSSDMPCSVSGDCRFKLFSFGVGGGGGTVQQISVKELSEWRCIQGVSAFHMFKAGHETGVRFQPFVCLLVSVGSR